MQGLLSFAGIQAEGAFSVIRSRSCISDPITAKFFPDDPIPAIGDVIIAFGANSLYLRNCRVVQSEIVEHQDGRMLQVTMEDRRWMWRHIRLFASVGVDIRGQKRNQKTFMQMVQHIVFAVLGEHNADISVIDEPNTHVEESYDGEIAIDALEDLLASRGYLATLSLDDRLVICRQDVGGVLPSDDLLIDTDSAYTSHVIPAQVHLLSKHVEFPAKCRLVPVGEEPNGEVKPIDELSYKPAKGWRRQSVRTFSGVAKEFRELAKRCVWRMYRVEEIYIPNYSWEYQFNKEDFKAHTGGTASVDRFLPLLNYLDPYDQKKKPVIQGIYCYGKSGALNNQPALETSAYHSVTLGPAYNYEENFSVDVDRGIVMFTNPVYQKVRANNQITENIAADIVLRCAVKFRTSNWQFIRAPFVHSIVNPNAVPGLIDTVIAEELEFYPNATGSASDFNILGQALMRRHLRELGIDENTTARYSGFRFDIQTDGRIDAVRWVRGDDGVSVTVAEWQTQKPRYRLSYQEKVEKLKNEARDIVIAEVKKARLAAGKKGVQRVQ